MLIEDKKEALLELANAWYNGEDFDPVSDLEFDALENEIKEIDPDWDYREHLNSQGKDIKHYIPMVKVEKMQETEKSMQEVFEEMELDPDSDTSPKYDGGGLCLYYKEGKLYDALTRSSTTSGKRQLSKILSMVPNEIDDEDIVAIECEALCTLDKGHGDLSRQAATGLLNSNSLQERCENEVTIIAFKVRFKPGTLKEDEWVQSVKNLPTLNNGKNITFMPTPFNQGKYIGNKFEWDNLTFLIDGIVEYKNGKSLAHKLYYNEKKTSTITKIEWNLTESSLKYVPKYIYETVNIDGTDCSRATAGGTAQLWKMKCGVGAEVEIIKAGLTIPQVLRPVSKKITYDYPIFKSEMGEIVSSTNYFTGDHHDMVKHFNALFKSYLDYPKSDKEEIVFTFSQYISIGSSRLSGLNEVEVLNAKLVNISDRLIDYLSNSSRYSTSTSYSLPITCGCGTNLSKSDDLNGGLYCSNKNCSVIISVLENQLEETGMELADFIFTFPKIYIEKYLKIPRFGGWKKLKQEYSGSAGEVSLMLRDPSFNPYHTMNKYFNLSGIQKEILKKLGPVFQNFLAKNLKEEKLPIE